MADSTVNARIVKCTPMGYGYAEKFYIQMRTGFVWEDVMSASERKSGCSSVMYFNSGKEASDFIHESWNGERLQPFGRVTQYFCLKKD